MTRFTGMYPKYLLAVLSFGCVFSAIDRAQSSSIDGLTGNLSVYQRDGVYTGVSQRISPNEQSCRPGQQVVLQVRAERFKLAWNDRQVFDAAIARSGTFFAMTGTAPGLAEKHMTIVPTLQGHVGPDGLVADYGTRWCRYRLEANQAPAAEHLSHR